MSKTAINKEPLSSEMTQQRMGAGIHFRNACAAIKMAAASQVLDLTEDDYDFLIQDKLWIATDRSRARRVVEAAVYGALDYLAFPRFAVPAEFIAAAIAFYVHPVNMMTASLIMEGCEWSENIVNGVDRPVKAREVFALVLQISAGEFTRLDATERALRQGLPTGE